MRLLASVATVEEAGIAVAGGADLVDLKNPHEGALGALPISVAKRILRSLPPTTVTSATTGDQHHHLDEVVDAVRAIAEVGVNYIKVAQQPQFRVHDLCARLDPLASSGLRIILVLFADDEVVRSQYAAIVDTVARHGFAGIMIDTANKQSGRLRTLMDDRTLADFVNHAQSASLLTGLAGSLTLSDIEPLAHLNPDYLGFRGALCNGALRTHALDVDAVKRVHDEVARCVAQITNNETKSGTEVARSTVGAGL